MRAVSFRSPPMSLLPDDLLIELGNGFFSPTLAWFASAPMVGMVLLDRGFGDAVSTVIAIAAFAHGYTPMG